MLAIAADPKHLGAKIAITAVLHAWGSAMTHHPHVHMTVPGGGLSLACPGQRYGGKAWLSCRPRFLLPVRVLSRRFRRLVLEKLRAAHEAGHPRFFNDHAALADGAAFKRYLKPLRKAVWVVDAKQPFAGPEAALAYLSRHTHRATPTAPPTSPGRAACRPCRAKTRRPIPKAPKSPTSRSCPPILAPAAADP